MARELNIFINLLFVNVYDRRIWASTFLGFNVEHLVIPSFSPIALFTVATNSPLDSPFTVSRRANKFFLTTEISF